MSTFFKDGEVEAKDSENIRGVLCYSYLATSLADVIKSFSNHGISASQCKFRHLAHQILGYRLDSTTRDKNRLTVSSQDNRDVLSQSWLFLCGLVMITTSTKMIPGLVVDNDSINPSDTGGVITLKLSKDITTMASCLQDL